MTNIDDKTYRTKKIYLDACHSIMEQIYLQSQRYISHSFADSIIDRIKNNKNGHKMHIDDANGAFFDLLCRRLCSEIYKSEVVILIISPYYKSDLICGMIVPFCNSAFLNISPFNICKDNSLYTLVCDTYFKSYHEIASEFIYLSEKIQRTP